MFNSINRSLPHKVDLEIGYIHHLILADAKKKKLPLFYFFYVLEEQRTNYLLEASKMTKLWIPDRRSRSAAANPAIPAPTMTTSTTLSLSVACSSR